MLSFCLVILRRLPVTPLSVCLRNYIFPTKLPERREGCVEELRDHKVVPVVSHKFDLILLPSSQWYTWDLVNVRERSERATSISDLSSMPISPLNWEVLPLCLIPPSTLKNTGKYINIFFGSILFSLQWSKSRKVPH